MLYSFSTIITHLVLILSLLPIQLHSQSYCAQDSGACLGYIDRACDISSLTSPHNFAKLDTVVFFVKIRWTNVTKFNNTDIYKDFVQGGQYFPRVDEYTAMTLPQSKREPQPLCKSRGRMITCLLKL
jgi:hypothetical protein